MITELGGFERWWGLATKGDRRDGSRAYRGYNVLLRDIATLYGFDLDRVCAAFVSLSPNADYLGNLRSLVTVLDALRAGRGIETVNVSTYRHCLLRAWAYATGAASFMAETKGPKIISFYRNILDPQDDRYVTIDGHMKAMWVDRELTMKQATIRTPAEYDTIVAAVAHLAHDVYMVPCQVQATLWFTRKRVLSIRSTGGQAELFGDRIHAEQIRPFRPRVAGSTSAICTQLQIPGIDTETVRPYNSGVASTHSLRS